MARQLGLHHTAVRRLLAQASQAPGLESAGSSAGAQLDFLAPSSIHAQ
jgi:hypothetical protein